jgi:hypothetical protein
MQFVNRDELQPVLFVIPEVPFASIAFATALD